MLAVMIDAIQVGGETSIEPPACLATRGTVSARIVVVAIFGGEGRATMIGKRVTSSSYRVRSRKKEILQNGDRHKTRKSC